MSNSAQNRGSLRNGTWWQTIIVILLTAFVTSIGSGVVSGLLAARAVAERVAVEQGKAINELDKRVTAVEVLSERAIIERLQAMDGRINKLEGRK